MSYLSQQEFTDQLNSNLEEDFVDLRRQLREQFARFTLIFGLVFLALFFGVRAFFPPLMLLFLFLCYLVYFFVSGRHKRRRVNLSAELRKTLLSETAQIAKGDYESALLPHRFMPEGAFEKSQLFEFEPDTYQGRELVEFQGAGSVELGLITASRPEDAFEEGNRPTSFQGYLLKIKPAGGFFGNMETGVKLPEGTKFRFDGEHGWMSYATPIKLYSDRWIDFKPDYSLLYRLYLVFTHARMLSSQAGR